MASARPRREAGRRRRRRHPDRAAAAAAKSSWARLQTAGWVIALSYAAWSGSRKTIDPRAARSREPSARMTAGAELLCAMAAAPGCPARPPRGRACRRRRGRRRARRDGAATTDFPDAMPPVSPIRYTLPMLAASAGKFRSRRETRMFEVLTGTGLAVAAGLNAYIPLAHSGPGRALPRLRRVARGLGLAREPTGFWCILGVLLVDRDRRRQDSRRRFRERLGSDRRSTRGRRYRVRHRARLPKPRLCSDPATVLQLRMPGCRS